jgi:hypothetical protein
MQIDLLKIQLLSRLGQLLFQTPLFLRFEFGFASTLKSNGLKLKSVLMDNKEKTGYLWQRIKVNEH